MTEPYSQPRACQVRVAAPASACPVPACPVQGLHGRAFAVGTAAAAGVAAAAWWWPGLDADAGPCIALGFALAVAAGLVEFVCHGRLVRSGATGAAAAQGPAAAVLAAGRFQSLLAIGFAAKLVAAAAGILWLRAADVKFPAIVAFGVVFAAAALVSQLTTALMLARRLRSAPAGGSLRSRADSVGAPVGAPCPTFPPNPSA